MPKKTALAVALTVCVPQLSVAGPPIEQVLARLAPEERSHQACILKGLDEVRRDPRLRMADRMKTSIFSPAVLDGTRLQAKGGAVRAGGRWYALDFTCKLTDNLMKATSFSFAVGREVPKESWEKYGLWG
jgi:hypothetical protein